MRRLCSAAKLEIFSGFSWFSYTVTKTFVVITHILSSIGALKSRKICFSRPVPLLSYFIGCNARNSSGYSSLFCRVAEMFYLFCKLCPLKRNPMMGLQHSSQHLCLYKAADLSPGKCFIKAQVRNTTVERDIRWKDNI